MTPYEPVWGRSPEPVEGSVSTLEALEGLPIAGARGLDTIRLLPVVAATLRAAVDLLIGDEPPGRPLTASGDGGALEVTVPGARPESFSSAGALLETIEGNLSPASGNATRLCVPVVSARPFYLMLEQGTLGLAVPWHAVIRVRLVRADQVEELARREGCPVLAPWVSVPHESDERPVVLLGLGLRRAFLVADRLVWRMPADPEQGPGPGPDADLGHAVRTSEGEVFWVADPVRLLRGVDPGTTSFPPRSPARPVLSSRAPAERPAPARTSATRPPLPRLVELRREDVEPLSPPAPPAEHPTVRPAPVAPPSPAVPPAHVPVASGPVAKSPAPPPSAAPRPLRRALVAEDSIVGRIFLQRLLQSLGFSVETVKDAIGLEALLPRGPWDVLLVDVALPDSLRGRHLDRLAAERIAATAATIALVRDRDDETVAAAAGIRFALRKPFERGDLIRALAELGLAERPA
jgi:CheY-like chemotaxis protein